MTRALFGFLMNGRVGYFVYEATVIRANVVLGSLRGGGFSLEPVGPGSASLALSSGILGHLLLVGDRAAHPHSLSPWRGLA